MKTLALPISLLLFLVFGGVRAQATEILERTISVNFEQTTLKEALAIVAQKAGFEWSYNANLVDETERVTLLAQDWSVREVLYAILGDGYTYKQSSEYLILKRQKKKPKTIGGYITDPETGQRMVDVTVYDRKTLRSTTTNKYGYYELPFRDSAEIVVSKLAYRDTVFQLTPQTPRLVRLELIVDTLPRKNTISFSKEISKMSVRLEEFFVRSSQKLSVRNVRDSLERYVQFSVLPWLGTNHRLSGNVTNDWSFNLLAGYSRSNRILEVAGLGNITREEVRGIQAAGIFNVVGDKMTGVQAAGLFNNLGNKATGAQFAGLYNLTGDTLLGAQFSGLFNYAGYTGEGSFQASSLLNLAPAGRGATQMAAALNHAHEAHFQASAIGNTADTLRGVQMAGLFNRAEQARGVQVGIINFAREIRGAQIGLVNLSKTGGYVVLELSANDVFYANAAFKSGVPAFYTILTGGYDPDSPEAKRLWAIGGGFGARARLTRWSGLSFDLLHRHLSEGSFARSLQEWDQLALSLDLNLGKHLSLAGGPTANLFFADPARPNTATLRDRLVSKELLDASQNADGWLSAWWGWTAAVRVRF